MDLQSIIVELKDIAVDQIADNLAKEQSGYQKARSAIRDFRTILQEMAISLAESNENRPLVVVINELDRCRPTYAAKLLEVAKHLFAVDNIVFVLAVNRDQLDHSIRGLYGSEFDAKGYLRRSSTLTSICRPPEGLYRGESQDYWH